MEQFQSYPAPVPLDKEYEAILAVKPLTALTLQATLASYKEALAIILAYYNENVLFFLFMTHICLQAKQ
jgi:hypothetical protein